MSVAWVRGLALTLAVMAIALKVMIPAGFMAAPSGSGTAPLVLCTAQGMMVVDPGDPTSQDAKNPAGKSKADTPCAFAGHGVSGLLVDPLANASVAIVAYPTTGPLMTSDTAPGRGLAAPPPPARGPPLSI